VVHDLERYQAIMINVQRITCPFEFKMRAVVVWVLMPTSCYQTRTNPKRVIPGAWRNDTVIIKKTGSSLILLK
jgi:hypothetical protein